MTRARWSIGPVLAALVTVLATLVPSASAGPGARWLAPVVVNAAAPGGPSLAVTPAGDTAIAWTTQADPAVWVAIRPAGTAAWPAPVRLTAPCPAPSCGFGQMSVVAGGDGTLAVSWIAYSALPGVADGQVTVATRAAGAAAFGAPVPLGDPAPTLELQVGVDGQGQVTATWRALGDDLWSARTTAGTWGAPAAIARAPAGGANLRLAVGTGGDAVATWVHQCVPTAARRRGGTWEAPVALDPAPRMCPGVVDARITSSGEALAVWDGRQGPDLVLRSAAAAPAGASWTVPQTIGRSDGRSLILSQRVSRGPGAGSRLVWQDDQGITLTSGRPDGGVWSAPVEVPGMSGAGPVPASAVGGDGTVLVATGAWTTRPSLATAATADGSWTTPVPIAAARPLGGSDVVVDADAAGEGVAAWGDHGAILAADFTARPGPAPALPAPTVTALRGPGRVPVGSLAVLAADATLPGGTTATQVQRLVRGAWRRYATVPLVPTGGEATARARLRIRAAGTYRLRLVPGGGAPSPAVTVRVTRPARRHVPVGPAPSRIVVGAGGIWVLGQDAGGATVRRLDPRTGAVRRTFRVGGTASGLAAGAGAVWVVRGSDLLRLDPATGAVTASSRICGIHGRPVAGREGVWTVGGCDPDTPGLFGFPYIYAGVAFRIDPTSATPVGAPLGISGADVFGGALAGGVLWLVGGGDDFRDGATAASFDVATGAPRAARGATPPGTVVPIDAQRVWVTRGGRIEQALPRRRVIGRAPHGTWVLAPPAGRVWALASVLARDGTTARTLTSFTTAGRKGAVRAIGVSPKTPDATVAPVLAVGFGAVWILLPDEGAVVRVPLR